MTKLYLDSRQLTALPEDIRQQTEITELYIFENQLPGLPDWIGEFAQLRVLDMSTNEFTSLRSGRSSIFVLQPRAANGDSAFDWPFAQPALSQFYAQPTPIPAGYTG
jgi:Leucine-rich repeat (LRR) protein